jgi:predicted ABC-type ATPase
MPAKRARKRPMVLVLAGVNGAGKSSVGGAMLHEHGLTWFNPDAFSRELTARGGIGKEAADAAAWGYGKARLEAAIADKTDFAFETTLGGSTMARLIDTAAATHDVVMIFCGLDSIERHIARVKLRVRHGGHDIPEGRIRSRWSSARRNLIALLPRLAHLQLFDNSQEAPPGSDIPEPVLLLEIKGGRLLHPGRDNVAALDATPDWAKPIVEAAFRCDAANGGPGD